MTDKTQTPRTVDEALEWMRFGCPFKPNERGYIAGDYDVPYFERRMGAAADFLEKELAAANARLAGIVEECVAAVTVRIKDGCSCEMCEELRAAESRIRTIAPAVAEKVNADKKLWLWKNFVDGRPEYWAFDNPYPTYGGGDPMTLGEPCGYAIFKDSTISPTHADFSEAEVIAAIQRTSGKVADTDSAVKCDVCGEFFAEGHECGPPLSRHPAPIPQPVEDLIGRLRTLKDEAQSLNDKMLLGETIAELNIARLENKLRSIPQPAGGVVVLREPSILTAMREHPERFPSWQDVVEYIDALLAAAQEPRNG